MNEFSESELSSTRDLVVASGSTRSLPARRWRLRNLIIETGARLIGSTNAQTWLLFEATGTIEINGKLEFRAFSSERRNFSTRTSSGRDLDHAFSMSNLGGNGGRGRDTGGAPGGAGAPGTRDYGGGGGGGGTRWASGNRFPGDAASGSTGGNSKSSKGGNGGKRGPFSNGGLLYLSAEQILGNGSIDVTGLPGASGEMGDQGATQFNGAGGSGGGAPGGEGGVVILETNDLSFDLEFLVSGGQGGQGAGGVRPGTSGGPGAAGFVD